MELALNIAWFAAVVAAAAKFASWRRDQSPAHQRAVALSAICVLALLFPIVSATDDLNAAAAAAEETSAMRRASLAASHLLPLLVAVIPLAIVPPAGSLTSESVRQDVRSDLLSGFAATAPLRAPPSLPR